MKTILFVLQYLPSLIAAVRSLEEAIPFAGQGKAKLDIIVGTVDAIYETSKDVQKDMPKDQLINTLIKVAGVIVGTFNKLGIFKSAPAPVAA